MKSSIPNYILGTCISSFAFFVLLKKQFIYKNNEQNLQFYSHGSEKITKVMALQQHVQQSMFYKNDGGYNAWATVCKSM